MIHKLVAMAGVAAAGLASGCCMCASPYDYCSPTFLGPLEGECLTDVRVGSAFTPLPVHDGGVIEGPAVFGPERALPGEQTEPPEPELPDLDPTEPPRSAPELPPDRTTVRPASFRR